MPRKNKVFQRRQDGEMTPEQQERVNLVQEKSEQGSHYGEDMLSYSQLAYYAGHQYIAMNRTTRTIVPLPKEPWEVQYTANRILPSVRTELAKVLRNKLTKKVVPASSDDEDIRSAKVGDKVVEWLEYEKDLQAIDEEAVLWTLVTRISFIKVLWNPTLGIVIGEEGGRPIKEGDIEFEVCNIFEMKWDPAASNFKKASWKMHEKQRSVKWVKGMHGVEVEAEEDLASASIYQAKLGTLTAEAFNTTPSKAKDQVIVREYWEEPCVDYPKGRKIVTANGIELEYSEDIGFGEADDTDREVPIFHLLHIPIPGKVVGTAITEQLMPVQKEYNRSRSQVIQNKNLTANPKWVAQEGSTDDIDSAPGSIVWYKKGFDKPTMEYPPPIGSDVHKSIEQCIEEFRTIASQQEVSQGTAPTGVSSGVAIQLLQEQDDTKIAPTTAKYGRYKQDYLSYGLKMIRYKYDVKRTVKMVGSSNRMESFTFAGSDLTSVDVRLEDMSLTQLTSSAKKQYIIELIGLGVLNPELDKDLIIRALQLGMTDEVYDAAEIDISQALGENAAWAEADFSPIVREFYNHEVHIQQHDKFRKSDEYDKMDPQMQKQIDDHVALHEHYIMMELQQQAGMMPPVPGETGEEELNLDNVMGALTPEEQQALQQDPTLLDSI
jgi:hypothetical protein